MTHQRVYAMPAFLLGALAALTWPVWRWLWTEWWSNDYYSHGPLIGLVALYLVGRQIQGHGQGAPAPTQTDGRGLTLLAASLGLYLLFLNNVATYLAAFAVLGLLGGLIWTVAGLPMLRRLAFPLAYMALMIPLPFVERATLPLALWTGVCSGALVHWLGLQVTISGAAVTLPNTSLVIGAQCSGINSIMALMALTALVAYLVQGPLWGRLALVALSIPLAMAGNVLRVANLLFVAHYFGADAGFHFYHDYSGPVFFVLVILLIVPLTRLLRLGPLAPSKSD